METANKLIYKQTNYFKEDGEEYRIIVTISLDDDCHNNMCDWSITACLIYPDATCIDGILYDLDNVGDDGVLIKPLEEIPCPFCRTEEFIRYDPFNKEYSMDSEEDIRDWYMSYINEMRKYGGK